MVIIQLSNGIQTSNLLFMSRTRPLDPVLSTQYIQNSLAVDSDEMRKIQDCAARNKIVVSLGFSENDNNSVYIAQALIDSDGAMLMNRRKLKATHMERTIFGDASCDSLLNVSKTSIGRKVGTLACWEHAQPLLKFNTISQKEEIHCAAWPPIVPHQGGPDLWSLSKEGESQVIGYCVPMAADRIYRLPESIPGLRNRIANFRSPRHDRHHGERYRDHVDRSGSLDEQSWRRSIRHFRT